jgi:hypothetical protein
MSLSPFFSLSLGVVTFGKQQVTGDFVSLSCVSSISSFSPPHSFSSTGGKNPRKGSFSLTFFPL